MWLEGNDNQLWQLLMQLIALQNVYDYYQTSEHVTFRQWYVENVVTFAKYAVLF